MVPLRLTLRNFLSYGEDVPPLDFSEFRVACITGQNGHGKSALLDAITWALWGEARRGSGDRKPDDGLLRIGASEMRVEFEFDLEGTRYRVIRTYRRTARGGNSTLELQAFDHDLETYVTASETGAIARTQVRVDSLLRMSYETFITSAMVLQGRANEFTTRPARERKAVLAEILGLSRYDELGRMARDRAQEAGRAAAGHAAVLVEIDAELGRAPELEQEMAAIVERLSVAEGRIREEEGVLAGLLARRSQSQARRQELEEVRAAFARARAEEREAADEVDRVRRQAEEDESLVARRTEIHAEAEAHARLRAKEAATQGKLLALRGLESERSSLQAAVAEARHEVERRREGWASRLRSAREAVEASREVTARQAEIDLGLDQLEDARRQERNWEDRRDRFEALDTRRKEVEARIAEARGRISAELEVLRALRRACDERVSAGSRARSDLADLLLELERLAGMEKEREGLRDQGSSLAAQIEADRRQTDAQEREARDARARLDLLQRAEDPFCPLCESPLDDARRSALARRLGEEIRRKNGELVDLRRKIAEDEGRRSDLRAAYQRLKDLTKGLADLQARAVSLDDLAENAAKAAVEAGRHGERIADLEGLIASETFAGEDHVELKGILREVETVGYLQARHASAREAVRRLSSFEAEKARLDASSEVLRRTMEGLPEIKEKVDTADLYLREKRYAQREQAELALIEVRIRELGYDPDRHRRLAEDVARTAESVSRRDRLEMAASRLALSREDLARSERRLDARRKEGQALAVRYGDLEREMGESGEVEGSISRSETELPGRKAERDRLLLDRGGLTSRLERCQARAGERERVEPLLRTARKDGEIYGALTTAFGRDGIQALIIEGAVPEIESEANRILARLTANRTQIAIESLRDLKKGGTRETLDIKISDELGERSYELYSGGEAFRIDFALRIALARLLARRAGTRLRTLILDEGFGTQDAEGLEYLVEAIQVISEDFDKVLVITHVEDLKDAFPVRIQVTKYPDVGSRFEIVQ